MAGDSIFLKGSAHLVCEDYAQHLDEGLAFVGDGCSSAARSDIAARLSFLGIRQSFFDLRSRDSFNQSEVVKSDTRYLTAACQTEGMFSTVLSARTFGSRLVVTVVGDGHVILKRKDGTSQWLSFNYPKYNAPFYPAYALDGQAALEWHDQFPENKLHLTTRNWDGTTEETVRPELWVNLDWNWVEESLDYALLSSDGVGSFSDSQGNPLAEEEVIHALCSFKNRSGAFLKRRVLRMMDEFRSQGIVHRDDFSAAILTF